MSPPLIHQPGDIVNEVYSENIQSIIQICLDAGDDPSSLIEQAKRELQVVIISSPLLSSKVFIFRKWLLK